MARTGRNNQLDIVKFFRIFMNCFEHVALRSIQLNISKNNQQFKINK